MLRYWSLVRRNTNYVFIYLSVLLLWGTLPTYSKGLFPALDDLAKLKPIVSSSTCGTPSSSFCSSVFANSIDQCQVETCEFACCSNCGSKTPSYKDLGVGRKISVTDGESRNGSQAPSLRFQQNSRITPQLLPSVNYDATGFTISVWMKQEAGNNGTVFSKTNSMDFRTIFHLVIESYTISVHYKGKTEVKTQDTMIDPDESQRKNLRPNEWHLITVSAVNTDLSYYIDGKLIDSKSLNDGVDYDGGGTVIIGQHEGGTYQYEGLMQDILMYERALTNREVVEAFTGTLPPTYFANDCRCPPSHPRIMAGEPAKCIKNGNSGDPAQLRLKRTSHPVEYATDDDTATFWLSEMTENVTLDLNLLYSGLQVLYISMTFYGPQPAEIKIERSTNNGLTFQPWQYFAEDCQRAFQLQNNGPLPEPDSVNCIQYQLPLERNLATVTFQAEKAPPIGSSLPSRPFGPDCNHLYCSAKLLAFLKATHVRLHFNGHTLVQNPLHRYFGMYKVVAAGWCECFGHASKYTLVKGNATHFGRCVCECDPSTFTEGEQCDRCKPMYNNKPFRHGDKSDAYPCVKCECNEHADSCSYNQTLDSSPDTRDKGGGGVCVGCKHNTTGRNCETCATNFYREHGKDPKATDVCKPCECVGEGVHSGMDDCVKVGGQCKCKNNTKGRQCDICKPGFYNLSGIHVSGCIACGCIADGTSNRNMSCHPVTGQCTCKDHVTGLKCEQCAPGYYGLSGNDPQGCRECNCDPFGTQNGTICNGLTGQCVCKAGSTGRTCNQCAEGYHSLTEDGCKSCNCSRTGARPESVNSCDKSTGACVCKLHVEGVRCEKCKTGFYNLSADNPHGCTRCSCEPKGITGAQGQCDFQSGNCSCKRYVIGQRCDQCRAGTWNLSNDNADGCQPCNCFPKGTVNGDKKNPGDLTCSNNNGQCECLSNIAPAAKRCDECSPRYFWNSAGQGCVPCNCNSRGSVGSNCNDTGQCTCKNNVGGPHCDQCLPGYYGFSSGSCIACRCNVSGSLNSKCTDLNGECTCKQNVEGTKCDTCKANTTKLQQNNKYGCSGAPSEQPAPFVKVLTSRAMAITWSPPDNPNGIILRYELFRNSTLVYTGIQRAFNDTGLKPDSVYYFYIVTYTESGSTRSLNDNRFYQTPEDLPDEIASPLITEVLPRTAKATWIAPNITNGHITVYRLLSVNSRSPTEVVHCTGILFSCNVLDLMPFTAYNFTLEVCTNGGCGRSAPVPVTTRPTRPDSQPAPLVTSLPGGESVQVYWDEPAKPNGRIFRYELHMREEPFTGEGASKYASSPPHDPDPSKFRNTTVHKLTPYTEYEFRVKTFTADVNGDTSSNWTRHRTGEGTPSGESGMVPTSSAVNSSTVRLSWNEPANPQGIITRYRLFKYEPPSYASAIEIFSVDGNLRQAEVSGLKPYTAYRFTVVACNSFDCTGHSSYTTAQTSPSAPVGQTPPVVANLGFPVVQLTWSQPQTPNGPLPPSYNLSRAFSALYAPQPIHTTGVHFPGLGFYKFPSGFVPPSAQNQIEFYFRTQYADGLLLFLASDGLQTDMLALELRQGKPWLIFDCQDGPAAFSISDSVRFDDGLWHHVRIERLNQRGTLTLDNKHSATQLSIGPGTVIASNTGVYVGGLPKSFKIIRKDSGAAKINRYSFIGCIRDMRSQDKLLNWNSALEASSVEPPMNACPVRPKSSSIYFQGGGYVALKKTLFTGGYLYHLSLSFRSQLKSGVLLFAYGLSTNFAVTLVNSSVIIKFSTSSNKQTYKAENRELCDGKWHQLGITSFAESNVAIILDGKTHSPGGMDLKSINSELFLGGVPKDSEAETRARQLGVDLHSGFGGCIANLSMSSALVRDVTALWNADLDGCPPLDDSHSRCLNFNSSVIYAGNTDEFNDTTVEPFTDYLYRVASFHPGTQGSAQSAWVAVKSGQGAPEGLKAPRVTPLDGGLEVNVSWSIPDTPNGVLTQYRVLVYLRGSPQSVNETTVTDTSLLSTTLSGLRPFTDYDIRIEASTNGGSELGPAQGVKTKETAPSGVRAPTVTRLPRALVLNWSEPSQPNGVIIQYNLTLDGRTVYSGRESNFTAANLQVYTEYKLQLSACTQVGCSAGPIISVRTGELPPEGLSPPTLQVRGTSRIEVSWGEPSVLNGRIIRYEVLIAVTDVISEYTSKYNATFDTFSTVLNNLTAGTLYYVRVKAFTGGGGSYSNASTGKTIEDIPDDVPAPLIIALNKSALFVIMLAPLKPNGVITRYELYQDRNNHAPVLNVTQRSNYTATGFTAYSKHSFQVRACTVKGCSFGETGEAYTAEDAPKGAVHLNISIVNSTAVRAFWSRVEVPNGRLFYNLMIQGYFLVRGINELQTEYRVENAISTEHADVYLTYNELLPFNNYTMWINASNTVGFIISNNVSDVTPQAAPDGLKAPNVTVLSSTAVRVDWSEPALPNGILLGYRLYERTGGKQRLVSNETKFSHQVSGLNPFTLYEFRVSARTSAGTGYSEWSAVTTDEDIPGPIDAPRIGAVDSTAIFIEWDPPSLPNGLLLYYIIYQNNTKVRQVSGNTTNYHVRGLQPFTVYVFHLSVCTIKGCRNSSNSRPHKTLESVPLDLTAPNLTSPSPREVVVTWELPQVTNGIIVSYQIQRVLVVTGNISGFPLNVSSVAASASRVFSDTSVRPDTSYAYRVVAFTSAGGTPSPYQRIKTGEGDPEGIAAPTVHAVGARTLFVEWSEPSIPNGIVIRYVIRVIEASRNITVNRVSQLNLTVTGLEPYVLYSVVVSACTVGGCGDSPPTRKRTDPSTPSGQPAPTGRAQSTTSILVQWQPPVNAHGPIQYYILYRRTLEEPVSNNFPGPNEFVQIQKVFNKREYLDTGLAIFSLQQYKVMVVTTEGNDTSDGSLPLRSGPAPPLAGPDVNATAVNHTSVLLMWSPPDVKLLRGEVQHYRIDVQDTSHPSRPVVVYTTVLGNRTNIVVTGLKPSTDYNFEVTLFNGNGSFKSSPVQERTKDGVPEGFAAPELYVMSSTEIRATWKPPTTPNGDIVVYKVYANGSYLVNSTSLEVVLTGLLPFSLYEITVEVCTVYACTRSASIAATTLQGVPTDLDPPQLIPGPTFMFVRWVPPLRPNGIISGYQLFRRRIFPCPTSPPPTALCTYVECLLSEQLCGGKCYNPGDSECCSNVLHARDHTKFCCGAVYAKKNLPTDVCCGSQFHTLQSGFQCCNGAYVQVSPGRVCCPTASGGHVVGFGDSCCGGTPHYENGSKICVCSKLYDRSPPRKCCGGKVISSAQICCENRESGKGYDVDGSKRCCGDQFVPRDTSLCCEGRNGNFRVYNYSSPQEMSTANETCCGITKVSGGLKCCNERGYNATFQTCADRSTFDQAGCGTGVVCNKSEEASAKCNRCDFDTKSLLCGSVPGYYAPNPTTPMPRLCTTEFVERLQNQFDPRIEWFNDTGIAPHTLYQYYIVAINKIGNVSSNFAENRTLMAEPEGLDAPVASVISASAVLVKWRAPRKSNGVLKEYRLYRKTAANQDRKVIYSGLNVSFTDTGLQPFTGYTYVLEACTSHCSAVEMNSYVYTEQAAPQGVIPPHLQPINATAIKVTWSEPSKPNGIIIGYNISLVINNSVSVLLETQNSGLGMSLVIYNLKPYTNYTFQLVACTQEGCTASSLASTLTRQASPDGVHPPHLIVLGARRIEASWNEPDVPNGVVLYYLLFRGDLLVYNGTQKIFKDTNLDPVTLYNYTLVAATGGGSTNSKVASAITPESSPEGVPKPELTPRSSSEIFAQWKKPNKTNGVLRNYSILVNDDEHWVGLKLNYSIKGLKPYTLYAVRVKACTDQGCGISDRQFARTLEAPPTGQGAPTLIARAWNVVEVSWASPAAPNGVIIRYAVYRKSNNGAPLQVCSRGTTSCLDTGLLGHTQYFYRIKAINSAGYGEGPWSDVRTLEGPPRGLERPVVTIINATAASVSWQAASEPNGNITSYEINVREELQVPGDRNTSTVARVPSDVFNVTVNGLKPNTDYEFQVGAVNSKAKGYSLWTSAKTAQAPPSDLRPLQADKHQDGKSIRIFWDEPGQPNGLISLYKLYKDGVQVYSGTVREYSVGKLVPFTPYDFQLEACTSAGCTKGPVQVIYSAQIPPEGQAPPMQGFVNASAVELRWKRPAVINGVVQRYDVIRRVSERRRRRALASETVVYSTNDTNSSEYAYVDVGLQPYMKYQYKIRAVNSAGVADSDWLTVQTTQGAPSAFKAPLVIKQSATTLNVTWQEPDFPNGIISSYVVKRNESLKHSGQQRSFLDQGLEPYTVYSYTVTCCTGGGCTQTPPTNQQTLQARPELVKPPSLAALSDITINITWSKPDKPNGVITRYKLYEVGNSQTLYEGLYMSFTVSGKEPYTHYSFVISACTLAGCTTSAQATTRTLEAAPENMARPVATVAGSKLVRIEWKKPVKPNGIILYYLLTRNGSQVYNGTDTRFDDRTVAPYTVYGYRVTAVNLAGHVISPVGVSAATHPGAPDDVRKPVLQVLSSSSIKVTWDEPAKPNGVIVKYSVVYRGDQNAVVTKDADIKRMWTLQGLLAYTVYEVWITACTNQGCSSGESSKDRTFESAPRDQSPPNFPTDNIAARSVLITWVEPQQPNGFVTTYELFRRQLTRPADRAVSAGVEESVYNTTNGTQLAYKDTSVKPYSEYEYRVVSGNSAGRISSTWAVVKTQSAAPEGIQPPQVLERSMNKLSVLIKPPSVPNGEIRNYVLEVSGRNDSTGLELRRLVTGLRPYTEYELRVYVCTDGGCAPGSTAVERTTEAPPQSFAAPNVTNVKSRSVSLAWDAPSEPNGNIIRYDVLHWSSCIGNCQLYNGTDVGLHQNYTQQGLDPYVMYEFQIRAHNKLCSGLSMKEYVRTLAEDPRATGNRPLVNVSGLHVSVDWSQCFVLNGPLDQYELLENGVVAYSGESTQASRPNRELGEYTYSISATTMVDRQRKTVKAPSVTVRVTGEGPAPTAAPRTSEVPFYETIWFIVLVVLVALLILFILLAVCMCRRSGDRTVYVRERDPLPPRTKMRSRPPSMSSLYTSSDRKAGSYIDLQPMAPYNSSTTALFDSSEAINKSDMYNRSPHSGNLPRKYPITDEYDVDWGGIRSYSNRDSGLYDDEKLGLSDSDESSPYQSFKKEHYFTDTHL